MTSLGVVRAGFRNSLSRPSIPSGDVYPLWGHLFPLGILLLRCRVHLVHSYELVDERTEMASQRLPYPMPTEPLPGPATLPSGAPTRLPVLRPWLPSAADLLPYLTEIDQRRWYSNSGPLVTRLEEQLSRHLGFGSW